ncbi:unnamed protein product [Pylaiella littoralis]
MGTYAKTFEIPEEFPAILREFAKEAIREQPTDIYRFGQEYFEKLSSVGVKGRSRGQTLADAAAAAASDGQPEEHEPRVSPPGAHEEEIQQAEGSFARGALSQDVLTDRVALLFQEADTDGNGTLSRAEFQQQVFEMLGADAGLTPNNVLKIMAETDDNDNGVIEYKEFLPVAMETIQAIMATEQYSENKAIRKKRSSAKTDVQDYLVKGLPRHELEKSIQEIFRGADGDGSGALDRAEFIRCLKESGLGFTRREINLVLTLIDKNGDGVIDYEEFLPVCFSMIVEVLSDKVQEVPKAEIALRERVHGILLEANGGDSHMTSSEASDFLYKAGLGLRYVQVLAIMSAVTAGEDRIVEANDVADAVAGVMCALKQLESRQAYSKEDTSVNEFRNSRQAEGLAKVAGLDVNEFKSKLGNVLRAKAEGDDETFATQDSIQDAIKEAFPELEARQLFILENLADRRENGHWGFANIEKWGFQTLQEVQDQRILLKSFKTPLGGQSAVE